MKVLGIVVEYNPFHNGHIYHIEEAKKLTQCDYCIAVMSSSFVQRGEPAIIDKWQRSALAVKYGVDLVIELPLVYAMQSADYFAKGSIELLNAIGVTDLCFGSEEGHIDSFVHIAHLINDNDVQYNTLIKDYMKQGLRYPDACNKALNDLANKEIRPPNDLLGLSYVKEIVFNNFNMTPHCIKRTNDYHGSSVSSIASASAIRKAIFNNLDYSHALVHSELYKGDIFNLNALFSYLKYEIMTSTLDDLRSYHLVEEGLEHLLKSNIIIYDNMDDFISSLLSKRYTKPRIQRMLVHILLKNKKEDIKNAMNLDYIRILAMNDKGRQYLNHIKKDCSYKIISNFAKHKHPALDLELKATQLLSLLSSDKEFIQKEFSSIPYIRLEVES